MLQFDKNSFYLMWPIDLIDEFKDSSSKIRGKNYTYLTN